MRDELEKDDNRAERELRKTEADAKDALKEAEHRTAAAAEKAKRTLVGEAMSGTEKAASVVKEAGHNVAAEGDKAKRELRDKIEK